MKRLLLITAFCALPFSAFAQSNRTPRMSSDDFGGYRNSKRAVEIGSESGLKIGDHRMLFRADRKVVPVATYSMYLKELLKARRAGDDFGISDLAKSDAFFLAPNNVEIIVIETSMLEVEEDDFPVVKVRIVKGQAAGKAGWVPEKWLFEISK